MTQAEYNNPPIIIVSGLPCSGTSMMMKMLAAGGIELLTDRIRQADDNNPEGYFEFEQVKKMKEGEFDWIDSAGGKAVKVIATLVTYLPDKHHYKIIFIRRNMAEILASQRRMLSRMGKPDDKVSDEKMTEIFEKHLRSIEAWLAEQQNIETLYVNYNEMIASPMEPVRKITEFLGGYMDGDAMVKVINKDLYRERK